MINWAAIPSPTLSAINFGPLTFHFYALCIIIGIVVAVRVGDKRFVNRGGDLGDVATIAFWFNPGMMTDQQRLINPLGFKVASYRVDPEVLK